MAKKMGRPPAEYKKEYADLAFKFCLLGCPDKQLALHFGISESVLTKWKSKYPEFKASIKAGREEADAHVGESLYQRAMGYSHPEEKIFNNNGVIVRTTTIKHYPPDPTSMIFWLKNRHREYWRDIARQEHTGKDGGPIKTEAKQKFLLAGQEIEF